MRSIRIVVLLSLMLLLVSCISMPKDYFIEFETHGGGHIDAIHYQTIDDVVMPAFPIKEGYHFIGWYLDEALTEPFLIALLDDKDNFKNYILHAKWQVKSYDVHYHVFREDPQTGLVLYPMETIVQLEHGVNHSLMLTSLGRIYAWGNNASGQLGIGTFQDQLEPIEITHFFMLDTDESLISIGAGNRFSIALSSEGKVFAWGNNQYGAIGDGSFSNTYLPKRVTQLSQLDAQDKIKSISTGYNHCLALSDQGRVFGWGSNTQGAIGDGSISQRNTPVEITSHFQLGLTDRVEWISAGGIQSTQSFATTQLGKIFNWGYNSQVHLGGGNLVERLFPRQVTSSFVMDVGDQIKQVFMGQFYASALTHQGKLFVWGLGFPLEFNNGLFASATQAHTINHLLDLELTEKIISAYSASLTHHYALTDSNQLIVWGFNHKGQLGIGEESNEYEFFYPINITSELDLNPNEKILGVTLGTLNYTSLWTDGQRLFGWGNNDAGQLGKGTTTSVNHPVSISINHAEDHHVMQLPYGSQMIEYLPTREGYRFSGWFSDMEMTTPYTFSLMPAHEIKLYGYWILQS